MKVCTIAFVPKPPQFHAQAFLANLAKYPPKNDLILFSDAEWEGFPNVIKVPSPESFGLNNSEKKFATANALFLTAVRIVAGQNYDAFIYGEADMRVRGEAWDQVIFDEWYDKPQALFAGSVVTFNACNAGPLAQARWSKFVTNVHMKKLPPTGSFGFRGMSDVGGTAVFPMGAGAVYTMKGIRMLFTDDELAHTIPTALKIAAFDLEIGARLWTKFGIETYEKVAHLKCMFSGYRDNLLTLDQRIAGLESGRFKLVHQIKTAYCPA